MAEIRWAWNDAGRIMDFMKAWTSAPSAHATIYQLEKQSSRNQRRPILVKFGGKDISFPHVSDAVTFLRKEVIAQKVKQPCEKPFWKKALYCTEEHPIQKSREIGWWSKEKLACSVCLKTGYSKKRWYCGCSCNYNVCDKCFVKGGLFLAQSHMDDTRSNSAEESFGDFASHQSPSDAGKLVASSLLAHSSLQDNNWASHTTSDASTSDGSPTKSPTRNSSIEGPQVRLDVQIAGRADPVLLTFDSRPLKDQLPEFIATLDPSSQNDVFVLYHSCGSDIEVLHSQSQLQSLPVDTTVSMGSAHNLISTYMEPLVGALAPETANMAIRQLLALVRTSEALADETCKQHGVDRLVALIRPGTVDIDLACCAICSLLALADSRLAAMAALRNQWNEVGQTLIHSLLQELFSQEGEQIPTLATASPNATLTFLMWLLEDIVGCAATVHDVGQASGGAMYPLIVSAAQGQCFLFGDGFQAHAGCLVLCTLLRVSQSQVLHPELSLAVRQEIATRNPDLLASLDEALGSDSGFTELLSIMTRSCTNHASLELQQRQQVVTQLQDEKKFRTRLQAELRQKSNTLHDIMHFVALGDPNLDAQLESIIRHGWGSQPEGLSLLHTLLREGSTDTRLIKLVAGLCPDLDARDVNGNRVKDYALQSPNDEVIQCLVDCEARRAGNSSKHYEECSPKTSMMTHSSMGLKEFAASIFSGPARLPPQESISPDRRSYLPKLSVAFATETPDKCGSSADDGSSSSSFCQDSAPAASPAKGPTPDASHLGNVWMLQTENTKLTKENKVLHAKASELVMLRTRLDILTEENSKLMGGPQLESPQHQRAKTVPADLDAVPASKPPKALLDTSKAPFEGAVEASPAPLPVTPRTAVESTPQAQPPAEKGVGKGKGKAPPSKGKGKGPPSPARLVSDASMEHTASDASMEEPSATKGGATKGGATKGKGKGKGKPSAPEPSKPSMRQSKDLKSVPWTRFIVGSQIEEGGGTIWDKVNKIYDRDLVPVSELEKRFSKFSIEAVKAPVVARKDSASKKPKAMQIASIAQDQRFQIEVSLRTLPLHLNTGNKAVAAILDLNKSLLSADTISTLLRFLCPTQEQRQELVLKRQLAEQEYETSSADGSDEEAKQFTWDPVEQYMEDLARVPACSVRLSCWGFLYNLPDRVNHLKENLDRFEQMVNSFHNSQELPAILGLVLAFGNYLNGGKNEKRLGQADGFHIEMLGRPGGLDVVNDPQGCNVRQLIFKVFFNELPEQAERLLLELSPMFSLVQRRIGKDSDGVVQMTKTVRVQIEDMDKQLVQLKKEFSTKYNELKEGLQMIDDPADKFVVEIPEEFERERQRVDELSKRKDLVGQQFKALLAMYKAETYRGDAVLESGRLVDGNPKEPMTSEVWCKIWDDFFVVRSLVLGFDEKQQNETMIPAFCKDAPITVENLKKMWRLDAPRARKPKTSKSKTGLPPSLPASLPASRSATPRSAATSPSRNSRSVSRSTPRVSSRPRHSCPALPSFSADMASPQMHSS